MSEMLGIYSSLMRDARRALDARLPKPRMKVYRAGPNRYVIEHLDAWRFDGLPQSAHTWFRWTLERPPTLDEAIEAARCQGSPTIP